MCVGVCVCGVCVCVRYVQQICHVQTIRMVQGPNDPKRKSNGWTSKTSRQQILRSAKEVQAVSRAGSSLAAGRFAETRKRQRGPVHSVSSTRTSYNVH